MTKQKKSEMYFVEVKNSSGKVVCTADFKMATANPKGEKFSTTIGFALPVYVEKDGDFIENPRLKKFGMASS